MWEANCEVRNPPRARPCTAQPDLIRPASNAGLFFISTHLPLSQPSSSLKDLFDLVSVRPGYIDPEVFAQPFDRLGRGPGFARKPRQIVADLGVEQIDSKQRIALPRFTGRFLGGPAKVGFLG